MDKCTCKDCGDRYVGCHDQCEKYRMFKANRKLENEKKREYRDAMDRRKIHVARASGRVENSPLRSHKK